MTFNASVEPVAFPGPTRFGRLSQAPRLRLPVVTGRPGPMREAGAGLLQAVLRGWKVLTVGSPVRPRQWPYQEARECDRWPTVDRVPGAVHMTRAPRASGRNTWFAGSSAPGVPHQRDGRRDCSTRHFDRRDAHRRQRRDHVAGQGEVIEAREREVARDVESEAVSGVQRSNRDQVGRGHHSRRRHAQGRERTQPRPSARGVVLGGDVVAAVKLEVIGERQLEERGVAGRKVAVQSWSEGGDPRVTEPDQVFHDCRNAVAIIDIDRGDAHIAPRSPARG